MSFMLPTSVNRFPAYLQGMETTIWMGRPSGFSLVPSLPTRNGNFALAGQIRPTLRVPSLPTRNGNLRLPDFHISIRHRSQPTYKEWKPGSTISVLGSAGAFPAYLQGMETILPMQGRWAFPQFPAYLQGMETLLQAQPSPPQDYVPSLPTRNGNLP